MQPKQQGDKVISSVVHVRVARPWFICPGESQMGHAHFVPCVTLELLAMVTSLLVEQIELQRQSLCLCHTNIQVEREG
jgi:hypothetical protein